MDPKSSLTENYCCVKCRGNKALVRKTAIGAASLLQAFKEGPAPQYYLLTCTLCGYTEMYDTRIYATAPDPVEDTEIVPENT